jgi:DNA-binding NarL/FixJ family response regulator
MARGRIPGRKGRVSALVADSDPEASAQIEGLLARLNCDVHAVADGDAALAAAHRQPPGIVVLNVHLEGTSGYEVCSELRESFGDGLPIMFVADSNDDPDEEVAALLVGADHYATKPIQCDQFLARARRLLAIAGERPAHSALTPRELEVLELLVNGMLPADIAASLSISPKTTSTHLEHILTKLGAHSQAQAVAFAVRDNLVSRR